MKDYKKSKDYLSNKEMFNEIIECQLKNTMSDKLGKMFILMAHRYATKPNFSGYSYKDEMIHAGITACCNAFIKFDGTRSENPFSYFTSCIHHAFLQTLNKEKKQQNIRDELLIEAEMTPSYNYVEQKRREYQEKIDQVDSSSDADELIS